MTRAIAIFLLIIFYSQVNCQTTKEYFFKESLPVNDSSALILIIREPQTEFAKQLNHRIYRDSNFIKIVNENWYQEVNDAEEKIIHFCDYDMFFYMLEGKKTRYLNRMNSQCGISEINCTNLNVLGEYGSPLHVDTLTEIPDTLIKDQLFNSNYIFSNYMNVQEWKYCKTSKYPRIYYDYFASVTIQLDSNFTIKENIENYIKTFTTDLNGVNYNAWGENVSDFDKHIEIRKFIQSKVPCELEFKIYITKEKIDAFKGLKFEQIEFEIRSKSHPLVVFYSD